VPGLALSSTAQPAIGVSFRDERHCQVLAEKSETSKIVARMDADFPTTDTHNRIGADRPESEMMAAIGIPEICHARMRASVAGPIQVTVSHYCPRRSATSLASTTKPPAVLFANSLIGTMSSPVESSPSAPALRKE
jgi:hypothetical protein